MTIAADACWNTPEYLGLNISDKGKENISVFIIDSPLNQVLTSVLTSEGMCIFKGNVTLFSDKNIQKLNEFQALPANWNENGADRFPADLIELCKNILQILPCQPEIFPAADGSIQMEYEKESGEYLEFNVFENEIEVFRLDTKDNEESFGLKISELEQIRKVVSQFYDGDE